MTNEIKTHAERKADSSAWQYCGDAEDIRLYRAEISELRAKVESLAADAERLDWLSKNAAYVGVNPHARTYPWTLRNIFEIPGKDFRSAIDAAMEKEKA